ncbi:MAG TPA: LysE family transporter [Candidatus Dormibacteraeota bacterium]|nr:LysE family transporter [Candidatus Dormibacteraeota bacterium]
MSSLLLRGFALGFAVAASPGPIFFLCLRRTLLRGRLYGFVSGLGVATADAVYAAIAAFGFAVVISAVSSGRRPFALVGGAVLIGIGLRILFNRSDVSAEAKVTSGTGLSWAYGSTLGLTITNPATILSFAALAATLSLGGAGGPARPAVLVAGVLAGSATWWCVLAIGASLLRARVTPAVIRAINTFSGAAIAALGMLAVYSAFSWV